MDRTSHLRKPPIQARPFCIECPKGSGCHCGESPDAQFEWEFSAEDKTRSTIIVPEERKIQFHPSYSVGTAACRGTTPLQSSLHHFWEVRMTSPVYGTAVMIGIATKDAKINLHESDFVSVLGIDDSSWGFSYQGYVHHGGSKSWAYSNFKWSEGSIIGVHLDRWRGTVEFYLNRKPLGIAFTGIPSHLELYPVISSTAAKSSMRLICAQSYRCDLAFECVRALSKTHFSDPNGNLLFSLLKADTVFNKTKTLFDSLPPGLATFVDNNCWYLVGSRLKDEKLTKAVRLFTDNSKNQNWKILSSEDEAEEKRLGKENVNDRKKIRLASTSRKSSVQQKVETSTISTTDTSDDDESFLINDVERNLLSTKDVSASTEQCRQHHVESKSSESSPLVRKRFVLKKSK